MLTEIADLGVHLARGRAEREQYGLEGDAYAQLRAVLIREGVSLDYLNTPPALEWMRASRIMVDNLHPDQSAPETKED